MSAQCLQLNAIPEVPYFDGAIFRAGNESLTVKSRGQRPRPVLLRLDDALGRAGVEIPYAYSAIIGCGNDLPPADRDDNSADQVGVSTQSP